MKSDDEEIDMIRLLLERLPFFAPDARIRIVKYATAYVADLNDKEREAAREAERRAKAAEKS
jgi:hypothetical protein